METNTTGMGKQIAIWGGVCLATALIIGGMIYMTKRSQEGATNRIKDAAKAYAQSLNLNMDQFTQDLESDTVEQKVQADLAEALKIPITYTPTFFINGTRIDNPRGYEEFKNVITQVLNGAQVQPASDGETKIPNVISANDWVRGSRDAKVVIVEYSDFQCPACAAYFPVVEQLNEEFGNRIAFVYRHFPLVNIHPYAVTMAKASEAAGKQGKFWEMYQLIFQNQKSWAL